MSIKSFIKKMIASAVVIAALYGAFVKAEEQKKAEINLRYNALETLVTEDGDVRYRLLSNVDFNIDDFRVGYSGLNEANNLDEDTYFGRHALLLSKEDSGTSLAAVIKTTKDGAIDKKIGIRNTSLVNKLGGYGRIDAVADGDAANLTAFYGRPFGRGFSAELYHSLEIPFEGKPGHYTEVQVNKDISAWLSLVGRVEIRNFRDTAFMGGIAIKK